MFTIKTISLLCFVPGVRSNQNCSFVKFLQLKNRATHALSTCLQLQSSGQVLLVHFVTALTAGNSKMLHRMSTAARALQECWRSHVICTARLGEVFGFKCLIHCLVQHLQLLKMKTDRKYSDSTGSYDAMISNFSLCGERYSD